MSENETKSSIDQIGPSPIRLTLPSNAADVLRCLFFHGPTWDGNVPSKSGRDELVRMGLAARDSGFQWLTNAGMTAAFAAGIHREKEARESREAKRRRILRTHVESLATEVLGINFARADACEAAVDSSAGIPHSVQRVDER